MNFTIREEVIEALGLLKLETRILSFHESQEMAQEILKKFTANEEYSYPLWENIIHKKGIRSPYAWEIFNLILKNEKVILFFEFEDDQIMFLIEDGGFLTKVFENCFRFVFYITDAKNEFLLAFNDHDYLIGSGRATKWIEEIEAGKYLNLPN